MVIQDVDGLGPVDNQVVMRLKGQIDALQRELLKYNEEASHFSSSVLGKKQEELDMLVNKITEMCKRLVALKIDLAKWAEGGDGIDPKTKKYIKQWLEMMESVVALAMEESSNGVYIIPAAAQVKGA